jgi:exopolyphosphatase/guanosine-5'-triphosphate,3'-diphosphate pyrophosphatase
VAAIDLGTNTARLLIGRRARDGRILPLLVKRRITRLGGGFDKKTGISHEAWQRTVTALLDFAEEIRGHGVARVRAVATSAVRDAANGEAFCAEVFSATGIRLEVIDGVTEGTLTLAGVRAGIETSSDHLLVFDVGGGSTEYTLTERERLLFTTSLSLGVVRLTEGKETLAAMTDKIGRELEELTVQLRGHGLLPLLSGAELVGTAGTATTLAAISIGMTEYDYRRVNNYRLCLDEVRSILNRLLPLTPAERLLVPGLEKGREDLIIAGIGITLATMERFGFRELTVSDFGLLEGVLLSV